MGETEGVILSALSVRPLELPKYEILGEIGHGGMATVYRAKDRRLGREVALKVIHRHLRENQEVARRFAGEALAVAKVKHPNVVEVYDVSADDEEERYLVVELILGMTLRALLVERGPLPAEVAACIALEITRALSHAHRLGVVHRDVKPENVLIRAPSEAKGESEACVKLTDFGIAKLLDAQGVTCTGQVLGSPAHMSPEQIEGGDVDARSDVFSTGVLLYEMMTGTLPFEGKNPAQVLRRVLEGTFVPPERVRPEVGGRYGAIVSQALAHAATDRYPSAQALGDALEAELRRLSVTDARAEIQAYLLDPVAYVEAHRQRIPELLAERGAAARRDGKVLDGAQDFNRALSYRPDDTMLLAEVAGLARRTRTQKQLTRAAWLSGFLFLASAIAFLLIWVIKRPHTEEPRSGSMERPPAGLNEDRTSLPKASARGVPSEPEGPLVVERPKNGMTRRAPVLAKPERAVPTGIRLVRTPVSGPQNSQVRIDGKLQPWFATHELPLGEHTFEFVPPNAECCDADPPKAVRVEAGEGAQVVRGTIRFRPATLRLSARPGSKASCAGAGGLIFPEQPRIVPMDRAELSLTCTVFPPTGADTAPQTVDVDLRPGRTFTLTGP